MKRKFLKVLVIAAGVVLSSGLVLTGCKKNRENPRMQVKMIDAPGDYQQINVEVERVEVNHENDGWISLPTQAGVYDLLTLQNDISAVLVNNADFPEGRINQMRLILGSNNTIMVDSIIHDLDTPSAEQTGLKFNLGYDFENGETYEVVIDFVADKSIVERGNGTFGLKPVIKVQAITAL